MNELNSLIGVTAVYGTGFFLVFFVCLCFLRFQVSHELLEIIGKSYVHARCFLKERVNSLRTYFYRSYAPSSTTQGFHVLEGVLLAPRDFVIFSVSMSAPVRNSMEVPD